MFAALLLVKRTPFLSALLLPLLLGFGCLLGVSVLAVAATFGLILVFANGGEVWQRRKVFEPVTDFGGAVAAVRRLSMA